MFKFLKLKKKLLIAIGLFVYLIIGLFVVFPKKAFAESFSLGLFPPIIQIDTTPPADIRHEITIKNGSDVPITLSIVLKPFISGSNKGQPSYISQRDYPGADKDLFQKIQILEDGQPVNSVTLAPEEDKSLTLKIGLPDDEPPSDYYFSIIFTAPTTVGSQNGSNVLGGIATNVLLSIGPKGTTRGFLEDFSSPWFVTNGPVPFTVSIHNLSDHFVSPQGQILVKNMFGQLIGKVDLLQVNALSESSRVIPDVDHPDIDKALWSEAALFGPYTASLTISLSPEGPVFQKTIYFFAMPIAYIVGLFVLLIIVSTVVVRVRRRLSH